MSRAGSDPAKPSLYLLPALSWASRGRAPGCPVRGSIFRGGVHECGPRRQIRSLVIFGRLAGASNGAAARVAFAARHPL